MNRTARDACLSGPSAADQDESAATPLPQCSSEFAAYFDAACHDLHAPARGIRHYATFLAEDFGEALGSEGNARLAAITQMADRMERQLQGIRELYEASTTRFRHEVIDLGALLDDLLRSDSVCASQKPPAVTAEPLPTVMGDPGWLRCLLGHLLRNALIFNDDGRPSVTVRQRCGADAGQVTLLVTDNGIGIAEDHQQDIFELFRRLHPADRYGDGVGAGLTVARKIVERHGGELWLENSVPGSTTVAFTLSNAASQSSVCAGPST